MKNTAPKELGIVVVAGVFGLIGGGVSYVLYDFGLIAAVFIAAVVAGIVLVALALGWREPNTAPIAKAAPTAPVVKPTLSKLTPSKPAASGIASTSNVTHNEAATDAGGAMAGAGGTATAAPSGTATIHEATGAGGAMPGSGEKTAEKAAKPAATKAPARKAPAKAKAKAAEVDPSDVGSKPILLSAARDGGPDDLKMIKGVGPKMEGMLHEMGIYHFDQVSAWSEDEVDWVDANLKGFNGRVKRDDWVSQAKTLASGGTTEFSSKVKKGGVY